ncbi:MAG: ABC transporter substrate-binding protein [Firmicutes bacterium]|nr:ABC transporter substrate-binding protein [Bacillota bacterium]
MNLLSKRRHLVKGVVFLVLLLFSTASAYAKTEIVVMSHWSGQQSDHILPYFEEYERLNPDVSIRFEPVTYAELLTRIQVSAVSGVRPDIYHLYNAWLPQLTDNEILAVPPAEVQDYIRENFNVAAVEGTTLDGIVWGFPTEVNDYVLVYNDRLFKEAGLDGPPTTWDELREYAEKLTKKDEKGNVIQAGFASWMGDTSGVVHPFYSLLFANGGSILNEEGTKAAFNSPEGVEALEVYQEIVSTTALTAYENFGSGHVAMIVFAPWGKLYFKEQMGDRFSDVKTAHIPPGKAGHGSVSYTWSFVCDNKSKNQKEAWEFLTWLNSVTEGRNTSRMGDYLADVLGAIPSGNADLTNHPDALGDPFMDAYIAALEYALPEPMVLPAAEINATIQKEIESVLNNELTPAEALKRAESRVNAILADY